MSEMTVLAPDKLRVNIEVFEGPLDLLLYLIKKFELDIYDIPIAKITQEYLAYLELMKELNLDIAGEFLVMASTLINIKSKMLLPKPEGEDDAAEENPLEELQRRLLLVVLLTGKLELFGTACQTCTKAGFVHTEHSMFQLLPLKKIAFHTRKLF